MRWTRFFIPTTKETPKDATAPSHILMLRAGLIRQLAAGTYSYLPLGYRSLRKVENIVREEMNAAGGIELHMPAMHPISLWDETGRTEAMGDVLLRLSGPPGDWRPATVLGPTHEEVITEIVRAYLSSYKQLPITLYQIQTKFRGEARPKSGVLRTREFLMKDAYSFHDSVASLDGQYQSMYHAYCRIFGRCGLPYVAVEAESGAIGGDVSHEFMVLTPAGEDQVALTDDGSYAANLERASAAPAPEQTDELEQLEEVHTPDVGKVEEVCEFLGVKPNRLIKTLIYDVKALKRIEHKDVEWTGWVVALVRGDHEINDFKLEREVRAALEDELLLDIELATPESIEELTGAEVGFAGPQGLSERADLMIIDRDVAVMRNAISGANKTDYHVRNVNPGVDFPTEGEKAVVADIRKVVDGDAAPSGDGQPLHIKTAIEVGHVFKLGTKYSASMNAHYLNKDGEAQPFIMGCYGIGLNRILAAAIESHHDDDGIVWPMSIAPFEVLVSALDPRDEQVMKTAGEIHDRLDEAGIEVLFDDRDERAGFKFKDADLIGIPVQIVVGKKGLASGVVELKHRRDPQDVKQRLAPEEAVEHTIEVVHAELAALEAHEPGGQM